LTVRLSPAQIQRQHSDLVGSLAMAATRLLLGVGAYSLNQSAEIQLLD